MRRIVFLLSALLLIPVGISFGITQTEFGDNVFVFVQSTIRDSDGTLVAYLESTKFSDLNLPALKSFLDYEASNGNDPIITINGEKFQVIRRVQTQEFSSDGLVASNVLFDNVDGKPIMLARFAHDGYTTVAGDTIESMWTFVRPVS
ncbi:MAG: hypothetical protein K5785_06450 [Nitrosarchaeum sp.]|nr:hypothetical protein [Nitrosarchaeum sp.]